MVDYLPACTVVNVDSGTDTAIDAELDHYYYIDTDDADVTVTLPSGEDATGGHWIIIQNAPATGKQVGGSSVGNDVIIAAQAGETINGNSSETLGPPTSIITATCRRYYPSGDNSGTGAGQAGLTGWDQN